MQTIFVGTDRNGEVYPYTDKPEWDEKNSDFSGNWRFQNCEPSFPPPPGECREYRIIPAGEADAKDARIAELEIKLKNSDTYGVAMADDNRGLRERIRELEEQVLIRGMPYISQLVDAKSHTWKLIDKVAELEAEAGTLRQQNEALEQHLAERDNQLTLARGDVEVYRKQLDEQRDLGSKSYAVAEGLRSQVEQLEKQLADRSPGVMPEVVEKLLGYLGRGDVPPQDVERYFRSHFAPPDGHEWRRVTENDPITAADVERKVFHRNGGVDFISEYLDANIYSVVVGVIHYTPSGNARRDYHASGDITHILRPIAKPFVFAGEPGDYRTSYMGKTISVCECGGILVGVISGEYVTAVEKNGTFAGGRITGRVK